MTSSRKIIFWAWLPVVFWVGVIAVESSGMMSSTNTDSALYSLLTKIFGHVDRHRFEVFHALLRKCGHFTGYAILSLLFFRALVRTLSSAAAAAACNIFAVVSIVFTFMVALLDEWHQSLLPSRTGALTDVLLDTSGAVAVQFLLWLMMRKGRTTFASATHALRRLSPPGTCASSKTAATTASAADK